MGFIDFTNGEVLTADQMDLVMRQGVMRFADAAARDTALSEVLAEGMMAYLDDTDEVLKYDGTDWIDISGDITGVTAGTALTGGGTSGNVTLDVDESALTIEQSQVTDLVSDLSTLTSDVGDKQDDVISTQGDLAIGDSTGTAVRLPIGSADSVLTSNGTTATWAESAGGGGLTLVNMPFDTLALFNFSILVGQSARFSVITSSTDTFSITALDSSNSVVNSFNVDRDNPFTYYKATTEIAKLAFNNNVVDETAILAITNPDAAQDPELIDTIVITSTQSVTLSDTYTAYVFGGGGGGGGTANTSFAGGGGAGSGYFVTGSIAAGTYTATIGAGGSGERFDGTSGGQTSIGSLTADGGSFGQGVQGTEVPGDGGNGGSGGGGGTVAAGDSLDRDGGSAGTNGGDGGNGGSHFTSNSPGTGGNGSGVVIDTFGFVVNEFFTTSTIYKGGPGGGTLYESSSPGTNASDFASGGGGATGNSGGNASQDGGNGKEGYILLVKD